jgi:hypothetical protein
MYRGVPQRKKWRDSHISEGMYIETNDHITSMFSFRPFYVRVFSKYSIKISTQYGNNKGSLNLAVLTFAIHLERWSKRYLLNPDTTLTHTLQNEDLFEKIIDQTKSPETFIKVLKEFERVVIPKLNRSTNLTESIQSCQRVSSLAIQNNINENSYFLILHLIKNLLSFFIIFKKQK